MTTRLIHLLTCHWLFGPFCHCLRVRSLTDGVVVDARYGDDWGMHVIVRDEAGRDHRYAHMKVAAVGVGHIVVRGDVLGVTGAVL